MSDRPRRTGTGSPASVAWRLVRAADDARDPKPRGSRKVAADEVVQLLAVGWTEDQVAAALRTSPTWSPTAIRVELERGPAR